MSSAVAVPTHEAVSTVSRLTVRYELTLEGTHVNDKTTKDMNGIFDRVVGPKISIATSDASTLLTKQTGSHEKLDEPIETDPMEYVCGVTGLCVATIKVTATTDQPISDMLLLAWVTRPIIPDLCKDLSDYMVDTSSVPADVTDL